MSATVLYMSMSLDGFIAGKITAVREHLKSCYTAKTPLPSLD